jgi:hypothetical protein
MVSVFWEVTKSVAVSWAVLGAAHSARDTTTPLVRAPVRRIVMLRGITDLSFAKTPSGGQSD